MGCLVLHKSSFVAGKKVSIIFVDIINMIAIKKLFEKRTQFCQEIIVDPCGKDKPIFKANNIIFLNYI